MKRFISLLLAGVMTVSLFGCGKKDKEVTFNENGEYIPTETLKLTIWDAQGTDRVQKATSKESIPNDWLQEKSKVEIETIYGNDGGQWDMKLSRLIAGDNLPHMLYVAAGQGISHFKTLKDAGKLFELTPEMLQKYAPNVWNRVPEEYWEAFTSDGVITGIPYGFNKMDNDSQPDATDSQIELINQTDVNVTTNFATLYIRDDILKKLYPDARSWDEICQLIDETGDKVGEQLYDIPVTTTEEFTKLLYDIAALNMTEDGKKVYAFGYNGGDLYLPLSLLGAAMYGYAPNAYFGAWNAKKQEITIPIAEDGVVKEAAKMQNKMIRDNVIDPESLVQTNTMFKENVLKGLYAITNTNYVGPLVNVNNDLKALGRSFRYRPLYVQVKQDEEYVMQKTEARWTAAIALLNTLSEAEAIQVLNWINIQFSDEFEEILWWGTPEDGLYVEEDGVRKYTDDAFNKFYIEKDTTALTLENCKGLGSLNDAQYGEFYILPGFYISRNRWNPEIMRGKIKWTSSNNSAWQCKYDAEDMAVQPDPTVYGPLYVNIEEAVTFWEKREQWENPFKVALAAESDEAFEEKWNEALQNLNSIVNVEEMTAKMTEIAKASLSGN